MHKLLFIFIFLLSFYTKSIAQYYSIRNTLGKANWTQNTHWEGGSAPSNIGSDHIYIQRNTSYNSSDNQLTDLYGLSEIGYTGDITRTGGNIGVSGVLDIVGNISLSNTAVSIDGGILIVRENLILDGGTLSITSDGVVIILGNVSVLNGGGFNNTGDGQFVIFGDAQTDGSGSYIEGNNNGYVNGDTSGDIRNNNEIDEYDDLPQDLKDIAENASPSIKNEILPVSIISFTAQNSSTNNILIQWISTHDVQVTSYELQVSRNGIQFENIGLIAARNLEMVTTYQFNYVPEYLEDLFFRLKINQKQNGYYYSTIIQHQSSLSSISIYPNPTQSFLKINSPQKIREISIFNIDGKLIDQQKSIHNNCISLDCLEYQNGSYLLCLTKENGMSESYRFEKK